MGGLISANMAALAKSAGLPQPEAVMCVEPGKTSVKQREFSVQLEDLGRVPKDTLLLAVAGDRDAVVEDRDAKRIYYEATQIPVKNKNFVRLISDAHGEPPLQADHFAPLASNPKYVNRPAPGEALRVKNPGAEAVPAGKSTGELGMDALDFYGTWKLGDGLFDAAFYHGRNRRWALGNTAEQRFMGRWSDGVPVKELQVLEQP